MICPGCKANVPDGSAFCGICGCNIAQALAEQAALEQTAQEQTAQAEEIVEQAAEPAEEAVEAEYEAMAAQYEMKVEDIKKFVGVEDISLDLKKKLAEDFVVGLAVATAPVVETEAEAE